jgi:hypothetical protein
LARTKAVVASCVVLVPIAAVGAEGAPVKTGDKSGAYDDSEDVRAYDDSEDVRAYDDSEDVNA